MTWYYAIGNERQGPVDDATLDRLIAAGTVMPETLVWRAGMADWQPLAQARPPRPAIPAPPTVAVPVAGTPAPDPSPQPQAHPQRFGTPAFGSPQQYGVGAGAAGEAARSANLGAAPTEDPDEAYARVVGSGRSFSIGDVISRGWTLVTAKFGLTVGVTALCFVALIVAQIIPCIGGILALVLQGPIIGGLFAFYLKLYRTGDATLDDAFSGFQSFLPLFLFVLVQALITLVAMIPALALFFLGGIMSNESEALGILLMAFGAILGFIPAIYLGVSWAFAIPLIVDKRYDFWPAMELSRKVVQKRFLNVFGLLLACVGIFFVGVLAICLGIFVAMPVAFASVTAAYEDLFGDGTPRTA